LEILLTNLLESDADSSDADGFARAVKQAGETVAPQVNAEGSAPPKIAMLDGWINKLSAAQSSKGAALVASAISQMRLQRAVACVSLGKHDEAAVDLRLAISMADALKAQPGIPPDSQLWKTREEAVALLNAAGKAN
jgi:hypothetical protein